MKQSAKTRQKSNELNANMDTIYISNVPPILVRHSRQNLQIQKMIENKISHKNKIFVNNSLS